MKNPTLKDGVSKQRRAKVRIMELKQGDCIELMKELKDESVDCIITDPPYGENIGKMGFTNSAGIKTGVAKASDFGVVNWDTKRPSKEVIEEMVRVSKNQIIFGGNFMSDLLPPSRCWIIWDKRGADKFTNDQADCELIYTSFDKPSRVIRHLWSGMLQEDMKHKEIRYHPTQKPLKLMRKLIEMFTKENDIILDPFMGCGSTGIECQRLKRRFIGFELNKEYFEIASERIKQQVNQVIL